jgi:hypothetical protein
MTIHVFFFFPETAGKSLEQIETMFEERVPAWRTGVVRGSIPAGVPLEKMSSKQKLGFSDVPEV